MKDKLTPESKKEYKEDEAKYFRNIDSVQIQGRSATDRALVDQHLPTKSKEQQILDRWERGLTKSSRSGSFTSAPHAAPAIFPNGLKFASDFIDENTPGQYKEPELIKPPDEVKSKPGYFPKPSAVLDICIDCMKQADPKQYSLGMTIILEPDTHKLFSMGVKNGDIVVYTVCVPCNEEAKRLGQDSTPLALVRSGAMLTDEEIAHILKYQHKFQMHSGQEITFGQWNMHKRAERILENLNSYLVSENSKPNSPIFRNRENGTDIRS